jgi:hypothetical protein
MTSGHHHASLFQSASPKAPVEPDGDPQTHADASAEAMEQLRDPFTPPPAPATESAATV